MATLTKQARETIKDYWFYKADWSLTHATIAGYTRWCGFESASTWGGDRCGCSDDRCIGFHHDENDDCHCLPVLLEEYAKAMRAEHR